MSQDLRVDADLLAIRAIGPWIREALAVRLTGDELEPFAMRCELALQELAANIVNHGAATTLLLCAELTDDVWRVDVSDDGAGYDPDAQPTPDPDEPQVHGYGLMIVRQLTRRFDHRRVDGLNLTTVEFELP